VLTAGAECLTPDEVLTLIESQADLKILSVLKVLRYIVWPGLNYRLKTEDN
jgi:hypothetical protein